EEPTVPNSIGEYLRPLHRNRKVVEINGCRTCRRSGSKKAQRQRHAQDRMAKRAAHWSPLRQAQAAQASMARSRGSLDTACDARTRKQVRCQACLEALVQGNRSRKAEIHRCRVRKT